MAVAQLSEVHIMEVRMDVVIDTSALITVIVGGPERNRIVELTLDRKLKTSAQNLNVEIMEA